jgi:SRSO17 transposase
MSTLLDHPEAQELLAQTEVEPATVRRCIQHLTRFLQRYLPFFYRDEQRQHAEVILKGKLTGLQRKTTEPIAIDVGRKRRPLQHFVGAGGWEDQAVLRELRRHVTDELGDPDGVLVLDPSAFPKKGTESCGVARQWCGRLGKVENCQVGVFLAYIAPRGQALVDGRLYLPAERAAETKHRQKTYVPKAVTFQEKWRIGLDLVRTAGQELPHSWVVGDDELGRVTELRAQLRFDHERYVLDVPCNTLVRDLSERRPPARDGGKPRLPLFERADRWAARQPKKRWKKIRLWGGEKGPREVWALQQRVQTKDEDGRVGPSERLVVIKSCAAEPQRWYTLSNARQEVPLAPVVVAHGNRHGVEELFGEGNQEVGLSHYEVRSWTGWHHHMTLSLVALWFLQLERLTGAEKKSGVNGWASADHLQ